MLVICVSFKGAVVKINEYLDATLEIENAAVY